MTIELSESERATVARFGLDNSSNSLSVGELVDCIIGKEFTPDGQGDPIVLNNRQHGVVLGINRHGQWDVQWPSGETFSYQRSLLHRSSEAVR